MPGIHARQMTRTNRGLDMMIRSRFFVGATAILLGVYADAAGQVFVSGMRSALRSSDGGASWSAIEGADLAVGWYAALAPDQGGTILAVGNQGRVLALPGTVQINQ